MVRTVDILYFEKNIKLNRFRLCVVLICARNLGHLSEKFLPFLAFHVIFFQLLALRVIRVGIVFARFSDSLLQKLAWVVSRQHYFT